MLVAWQTYIKAVYSHKTALNVVQYLLNSALFPADEFSAADAGLGDPADPTVTPSPLDANTWFSRKNSPASPPPITYLEIYDCEAFSVSGEDTQPACLSGDSRRYMYSMHACMHAPKGQP